MLQQLSLSAKNHNDWIFTTQLDMFPACNDDHPHPCQNRTAKRIVRVQLQGTDDWKKLLWILQHSVSQHWQIEGTK